MLLSVQSLLRAQNGAALSCCRRRATASTFIASITPAVFLLLHLRPCLCAPRGAKISGRHLLLFSPLSQTETCDKRYLAKRGRGRGRGSHRCCIARREGQGGHRPLMLHSPRCATAIENEYVGAVSNKSSCTTVGTATPTQKKPKVCAC